MADHEITYAHQEHTTDLRKCITGTYGKKFPLYTEFPLKEFVDTADPGIRDLIDMLRKNRNYKVKVSGRHCNVLGVMDHLNYRWFDLHTNQSTESV